MAGLFLLGLFITLIGPYNTGGDYRHLVPDPPLSTLGEEGPLRLPEPGVRILPHPSWCGPSWPMWA